MENTEPQHNLLPGDSVNEMNRWLQEALDTVVSFTKMGQLKVGDVQSIGNLFSELRIPLRKLINCQAMGFMLLDDEGLEFELVDCNPEGQKELLQNEVDEHIASGTFAWALNQNHLVLLPSKKANRTIVFHVLATRSRVLGMFLAVLNEDNPHLPRAIQKFVSIILFNAASILETNLLNKELNDYNLNLEKKIEERTKELKESEERAQLASKTKSEFLANMTHELRTPMNGVMGMAQLLIDTKLDEEQKDFVNTMYRSSAMMVELINDILDFSKIEAGKIDLEITSFDLKLLLTDVISILNAKAGQKGIEIKKEIDEALSGSYLGDPTRIRQVLINLAGNAVKFTDKGHVLIKVSCVKNEVDKAAIKFEVQDTGIGIAQNKLKTIFDKFSQADSSTTRKYGGTGLGLSISLQLVDLMGGQLEVTSQENVGTKFFFELNLKKEILASNSLSQQSSIPNPQKLAIHLSGKVLLAEDNIVNQKVAMKMLQKLGFEVDVAANGLEAFEKQKTEKYHLIFMDCQMPEMDGYQSTQKIRETNKEVVIIAMTANAMSSDKEKCLSVGMNDFISKPVKVEVLTEVSKKWMASKMTNPKKESSAMVESSKESKLNPERIKKLLEVADGDQTFIDEILEAFLTEGKKIVQEISQAVEKKDAVMLKEKAHKLKGSSRNVGADEVGNLSEQLEKMGINNSLNGAKEISKRLVDELIAVKNEIKNK